MVVELSAFYFDIRKDALYCDAPSSLQRKAAVQVVRHLFDCLVTWLAPMLPFTTEEAWLDRYPDAESVHLEQFPDIPADWKDDALAEKWRKVRQVRRVVTGALEIERAKKTIGSSLEAAPVVYITDPELLAARRRRRPGRDRHHQRDRGDGRGRRRADAFALDDVAGVGGRAGARGPAPNARAPGATPHDVGSDPEFPDVSARDAAALRELRALGRFEL